MGRCRPSSRWTSQGIPAQLLLRRPDIRTAAWQIAAQSAQIGIAKADYFPAITLLGSIGWCGTSLDASPDTRSLVAGPALTWNVFDFGRIRGNVRLQDARLQQSIEFFRTACCRQRGRSTMPRSAW